MCFFCLSPVSVRPKGNCIIDVIHELEEMDDVMTAAGEVKLPKVSHEAKTWRILSVSAN